MVRTFLSKKRGDPTPWKKDAAALFSLTAFTRFCGLIRTLIPAAVWGLSETATVFDFSLAFVTSLYELTFGAVIAYCFIPLYARKDPDDCHPVCLPLLPMASAVLLFYFPWLLTARLWLPFFFPASPKTVGMAQTIMGLMILDQAAVSAVALLTAFLQAKRHPIVPAVLSALSSLCATLALLAFSRSLSALMPALVLLSANSLTVLLLIIFLKRRSALTPIRLAGFAKTHVNPAPSSPFLSAVAASAFLPLATLIAAFATTNGPYADSAACGLARKLIFLAAALLSSVAHALLYPRLSQDRPTVSAVRKPLGVLLALSFAMALALFIAAPFLAVGMFFGESAEQRQAFVRLLCAFLPLLPAAALLPTLSEIAYLRRRTFFLFLGTLSALSAELLGLAYLPVRFGMLRIPLSLGMAVYSFAGLALPAALLFPDKRKRDVSDPAPESPTEEKGHLTGAG